MTKLRSIWTVLGLAAVASTQLAAQTTAPDFVVHHAKVITADSKFTIAPAFAVKDGKILAVGDDAKILALAGPATKKYNLAGRTVTPGFIDTHNHQNSGISLVTSVDLTNIHSIADIQKAIAEGVKRAKPGEWVGGTRGWWEYELSDGRLPTRADLDNVSPDNPVGIPGPHYMIVNTLALKMAGITKDTPDPQGGEIWRDKETGDANGLLMDRASALVRKFIVKPSREQTVEGYEKIMQIQNSHGLTSIRQVGGTKDDEDIYRELFNKGKMTTRVEFCYSVDPLATEEKIEADLTALGTPGHQFGPNMFQSDCIAEAALDGAELTAYLRQDYPDRPGYRGLHIVPDEKFRQFAAQVAKHDWRIAVHAVGDAAIDEALDAFAFANGQTPIDKRRWSIDHAFLLMPDQYDRVKALGLTINSQYMHNYQLGELILRAWKRPLADMSERYKDWLDHGIIMTGGSDGPVSYHAEPLLEIYGEVTRKTGWGGSLGPDQGLTREQAIRSLTSVSAMVSFEENIKGSIEPGKLADFVLLSKDILTIPADDIKDTKVLATVVGGKTVFGSLTKGK
jgi:predicted amidohydrolase YtcJ